MLKRAITLVVVLLTLAHGSAVLASPDRQATRTRITVESAAQVAELVVLEGHTGPVFSLAFSPDSTKLASGGSQDDYTVRLWDVTTNSAVAVLEGHTAQIAAVGFSGDGSTVLSASYDATIRLWNASDGTPGDVIEQTEAGSPLSISNLNTFFSADGSTLVYGNDSWAVLNVFDLASRQERDLSSVSAHLVSFFVGTVAVSADGSLVAAADGNGPVHVIDHASETETAMLTPATLPVFVGPLVFSPDAKLLAVADYDASTIQIWNLETGQPGPLLTGHAPNSDGMTPINGMTFSPDGTLLVSASSDMTIIVWDVAAGTALTTLNVGSSGAYPAAFTPDGTLFATGDLDGKVHLWGIPGD